MDKNWTFDKMLQKFMSCQKILYFCAIVSIISKTFVSRKNYLLYLPHVKAIFANSPKCTPKPISGAKYCKHLSSLVYILGS